MSLSCCVLDLKYNRHGVRVLCICVLYLYLCFLVIDNSHYINVPDRKSNNNWIAFMKELDKLTFRCKMYDPGRPKIFWEPGIIPVTSTETWNKQNSEGGKNRPQRAINHKSKTQFERKLDPKRAFDHYLMPNTIQKTALA